MKKNRGMKIYKQKKRRRKGNSNQIMSLLGTCAVVFGVGIFGYYVVAVPLLDLLKGLRLIFLFLQTKAWLLLIKKYLTI